MAGVAAWIEKMPTGFPAGVTIDRHAGRCRKRPLTLRGVYVFYTSVYVTCGGCMLHALSLFHQREGSRIPEISLRAERRVRGRCVRHLLGVMCRFDVLP